MPGGAAPQAVPYLSTTPLDFVAKWVVAGGSNPVFGASTNFKVTSTALAGGLRQVWITWDQQASGNTDGTGLTTITLPLPDNLTPRDVATPAGQALIINDPDPAVARVSCNITATRANPASTGTATLVLTPSVAHTCVNANPITVPFGSCTYVCQPFVA